MSPQRIQQRRTKGWRKPEGAVAVGRGTKWGNPFKPEHLHPKADDKAFERYWLKQFYRRWINGSQETLFARLPPTLEEIRALQGRDLMCWCPLDQACHADVLLELANGVDR